MLYTDVLAKATNVDPDDEVLADVYEAIAATPRVDAPSLSADIVDRVVYVRADVEADTRVDAELRLVKALGEALARRVAGTRVTYVMPALAGE